VFRNPFVSHSAVVNKLSKLTLCNPFNASVLNERVASFGTASGH